jgi:hypothetical protein
MSLARPSVQIKQYNFQWCLTSALECCEASFCIELTHWSLLCTWTDNYPLLNLASNLVIL